MRKNKIKTFILAIILSMNTVYGDTIVNNINNILNKDTIIFIQGKRVYKLNNDSDIKGNHYLVASNGEETWDGIDHLQIPRVCSLNIKVARPEFKQVTIKNTFNSIPSTSGEFLRLNSILKSIRENPGLEKMFLSYTLKYSKGHAILVGNEIMKSNPDLYMEYREIVDELAPDLSNVFELGLVWIGSRYKNN
jgi:hypothetical protein